MTVLFKSSGFDRRPLDKKREVPAMIEVGKCIDPHNGDIVLHLGNILAANHPLGVDNGLQ